MSIALFLDIIRQVFGNLLIVTLFTTTYPALAHYLLFS